MTMAFDYRYDENGLRTQKIYSMDGYTGQTDNYYYNGSVLMAMTGGYGGSIYQRFSYDARGKVVAVDYSNDSGNTYTTYYYLRNAQGDIVKLIDSSGSTVVEYVYDSWGKVLSTTGTLAGTVGIEQPFRYRGYVYDRETQWYYLQSRYYNPMVGRFISADVYLSTGQGVIGHNAFAYCNNNTVAMTDDAGRRPYAVQMTDSGSGNTAYYASVILNNFRCSHGHFYEGEEELAVKAFAEGRKITYRGATVIRNKIFPSSFSLFGAIWLKEEQATSMTIRHEYGHIIQEQKLGIPKYIYFIGIPSAADCSRPQSESEYFSKKYEMTAEIFGGNYAIRGRNFYLPYAYEMSIEYFNSLNPKN